MSDEKKRSTDFQIQDLHALRSVIVPHPLLENPVLRRQIIESRIDSTIYMLMLVGAALLFIGVIY